MSAPLSTASLDTVAAQVIAGVATAAAEESAQSFFSSIIEQVEKRPMQSRRYTAAQFFLRHPEKFQMAVHYLARGVGVRRIAENLVGCSVHTVQAVRDQFPKSVATEKEKLADMCTTAATMLVERIIEDPDKVPMTHAGLVAAQLIDKAALLRGGPTLTIEHKHTFSHADFNSLVDGAIEVEVVTGKERENLALMGAGAPVAPVAAPAPTPPDGSAVERRVERAAESRNDGQSLVPQREIAVATRFAPPSGERDMERQRGGGGSTGGGGGTDEDVIQPTEISTNGL